MLKRKKPSREKLNRSREEREKDWKFYQEIWMERKHNSEISGEYLGKEALTVFFHHILPKESYPEHRYNKDNIIVLTWIEHDQVEKDQYYFEEINKRRTQLLNNNQ